MFFLADSASAKSAGRLQFMEPYTVDGLGVGAMVARQSPQYKRFRCQPSDQYEQSIVCRFREQRNGSTHALTILHLHNNIVSYINKSVYPAAFTRNGVVEELNRLSERFGAVPKVETSDAGLIARWGDIGLQPLSRNDVASLLKRENPNAGFLVDYMMNFQQSARLGLPIYRLTGGKGYIWIARFASGGEQAALRFMAADPSMMVMSTANTDSLPPEPRREPPRIERGHSPQVAERASPPPEPKESVSVSTGTGFFVSSSGEIATNSHVVQECKRTRVVAGLAPPASARIVARDSQNDLALLNTPMKPPAIAALRPGVRIGEEISVFGYPLVDLLSTNGNYTRGNVSAVAGMNDDTRFIQISAPVQPGNSGGAVIDQQGAVVGVVVAKLNALKVAEATKDLAQNVNFAIKTTVLMNFLDANGVRYASNNSTAALSSADLAEKAKAFSVLVVCEK